MNNLPSSLLEKEIPACGIVICTINSNMYGRSSLLRVQVRFLAEAPRYALAVGEYRSIWEQEGEHIIAQMEGVSGLLMLEHEIEATVYEG